MFRTVLATTLLALQAVSFAQSAPSATTVEDELAALHWLQPGSVGRIGDQGEFQVTDPYTFLGAQDTDTFLQINGNPPQGGRSYTIASSKARWFGVLSFHGEGYVKDDEKIDADELLRVLKEQNVAANEMKKAQGYPTIVLEGWYFPPRYDQENKRLEWGTRLRADDDSTVVNVSTKILGRSGYTHAVLVSSPETLETDLVDFKAALKHFDYVPGERYAEFREGDKVAAYGLGALVLGGAAAAASSKGGLKLIWLAVVGALAAGWSGVKRFLGRKA